MYNYWENVSIPIPHQCNFAGMGRYCMGRPGNGPNLHWDEFAMGRDVTKVSVFSNLRISGCELKDNYYLLIILLIRQIFTANSALQWFLSPNAGFLSLIRVTQPGRVAQSVGHQTRKSGVLGSIPGLATYFRFSFRFFKKGSCQLLAKVCARSTS